MNKDTQTKLLEIVKNNYDEIAADFSQTREKKNWPVVAELTSTVPSGASVLDVGCGNGRLLDVLPQNIEYLGTDSSTELIKIAQTRYPEKKFIVADMMDLSAVPDSSFEYIFCIAAIHHLPGQDLQLQAIEEMKKKLKPNGQIILTTWSLWCNKKFRWPLIKSAIKSIFKLNDLEVGDLLFDWKTPQGEAISQRYYHAFTSRELKKLVTKANLKIEKQSKDKYNYYLTLSSPLDK